MVEQALACQCRPRFGQRASYPCGGGMINLFLSASVPLPQRHRQFFNTADVIAIRESVKALVETVLKDSMLVFGGHPAITPLIALMLRGMSADIKKRVVLFQSAYFENEFVE